MSRLKLAAPWEALHNEIEELFGHDPSIKITYDGEAQVIKLYVDGERKADAISKLIVKEKTFGNVTVKIEVIPANTTDESVYNMYKDAFDGNPVVNDILNIKLPGGGSVNYVMFKKEVVQFYNDDTSDPYGLETTLYETIAEDIIERKSGEFFSTSRYNYMAPRHDFDE